MQDLLIPGKQLDKPLQGSSLVGTRNCGVGCSGSPSWHSFWKYYFSSIAALGWRRENTSQQPVSSPYRAKNLKRNDA
jgi:hypothetical protein